MNRLISGIWVVVLLLGGGRVHGDEHSLVSDVCQDCIEPLIDDCCCVDGHELFANMEAVFLRYFRADGLRLAPATNANARVTFDFEASPRLTLGRRSCDGLGLRVRWWNYDHAAAPAIANEFLRVDMFTLDLELFDVIQPTCNSELEFSAGVRYVDFEEYLQNGQLLKIATNALGGTVGAEFRRTTSAGGWFYARGRGGVLLGDRTVDDTDAGTLAALYQLNDTVPSFLDLGFGYQLEHCLPSGKLLRFRAGGELQKWFDLTEGIAINLNTSATRFETFAGPGAVGFGGFGIGVELCH